jgi:thiol-disulfide isomerase/thioredoxin
MPGCGNPSVFQYLSGNRHGPSPGIPVDCPPHIGKHTSRYRAMELAPMLTGDLFGSDPKADTIHYAGRVTFIDFWAINCAPCRHSMPVIDPLHRAFADRNIQFIGVNAYDDGSRLKAFFAKRDLHYPTLMVTPDQVAAFQVTAIPVFHLIDRNGIVAASWEGYGPGQEDEWIEVIEAMLKE